MKNIVVIFFLLAQLALYGQLSWVQKDSLPAPGRYCHISFVIADKAYAGLGSVNAELRIYSDEIFRYDPVNDSWEQMADLPAGGRYGATAFSVNGKGYVCLGVDNNHMWQSDVWEFDPGTGAWVQKANFPGGARYNSSSFVIGDKAYVACGSVNQGNNYLNDLWCYNPENDSWIRKANLPTDHLSGACGFSINDKGYIVAGGASTYEPVQDLYRYDPATNTWSQLPDFPGSGGGPVAFVLSDKAYIGTGTDLNFTDKSFWYYSPATNSWTSIPDPPPAFSQRLCATAFSIGGSGYVLGGRSEPYDPVFDEGKMLNDLWAYTSCISPVADFAYNVDKFVVNFSDSSSGATQYYWNFGDGTTSTEKDPVHTFINGTFHVCHTVSNECGEDSICKSIQIDCPNPIAGFFYTIDYHAVQFTDSSSGATQYYWDFGDGTTSTEKDPVHNFTEGNFLVCHVVTNECGEDIKCVSIQIECPDPVAGFLFTFLYPEYQFIDTSAVGYLVSRLWDFGDSTYSTEANPVHVYNDPGTYHVCLAVTDSCGTDTACDDLTFLLPLAPQITITPSATNDLLAEFTDETLGTTHWNWRFGDGDSSDLKNPSHLYKEYGAYRVCLTAGNHQFIGTTCDTVLLSVNPSLHNSNPVLVYPNPTEDKLFIRFYGSCSSTEVLIDDQSGRRILYRNLLSPDLVVPSELDMTGLLPGVYFVRVKCTDYNKVWKIVKL
jgi:PKD repeat protein/N-acetylneuraminic acid mutarotase